MSNAELDKIIKDIDQSLEGSLKGNNHYFYHLGKINKQTAISIISLIKTIKKLDNQNKNLSKKVFWLTIATVILAVVQVLTSLIQIIK